MASRRWDAKEEFTGREIYYRLERTFNELLLAYYVGRYTSIQVTRRRRRRSNLREQ